MAQLDLTLRRGGASVNSVTPHHLSERPNINDVTSTALGR